MKKAGMAFLTAFFCCSMLTGCFCQHTWKAAGCETPAICEKCGKTEGAPAGHSWMEATCEKPMTCEICKQIQGDPLGHTVKTKASCTEAAKCSVCGETVEEALGHDWRAATRINPKICTRCKLTEGEPLGVLDIYPEGMPRHDGTAFLLDTDEYLELFGELCNRGSGMSLVTTIPSSTETDVYRIMSALGQQLRFETNSAGRITRIIVETREDAEFSETLVDQYFNNTIIAYMVANGNITAEQFFNCLKGAMQSDSGGTTVYAGSLDGVAYQLEVRYHSMTMEIWVEEG